MWLAIITLSGLLLSGIWIGVALGATGVVILILFEGGVNSLQTIVHSTWNVLFNFSLSALPLYILLGEVFVFSGLARRSYDAITPLFERVPGKLLVSNVVLAAMFGAVVGSSVATAATVGSIAYPELRERGYRRRAAVGNIAGAGTLGSFIPPSLPLIMYGSWVQVSVGSCFVAAIVPALITVGLFMIYIAIYCSASREIVPTSGKVTPLKIAILKTKTVWPMIMLMASIIGTMYFGIATSTEAAGIGVVIAIVMSIAFRTFSFKKMYDSLIATTKACGMFLFILVGATILSTSVSITGLPRQLILMVDALGLSPIAIILLTYLLYLIMGCFFDFLSMMLMTLPFIFPLMMNLGVSPYWFGIVLVIAGEMGLLTPPVGMNLYVLHAVTGGEVDLGEVAKGAIPYFLMLGVTLCLITIFPQLCTWLPDLMLR